jgi:hypothetical protein
MEKIMARFLLSALGVITLVFSAEIERTPALAAHHQISIQSEPAQKPAIQEKRVALIIGNGSYVGANPLRNPPNDARSMSAALRQIGFDVIERIDLNTREMKRAVIDFGNKLRSNDVGLFYYAGHGVQSNGKNYLIPVDAEIEKEADITVDGVDLDTVMAQIEGAKNRLNIVILDACRNDFSTRGWNNPNRGLLQVANAPSGTFIAYATAPGSTASDNKSGQNGLYTQELLRALRQPGLRIEEVFKQVRLRVKELSEGRQIPWESSSLEGEFFFIPANSTVASSNASSPAGGRPDNPPTTPAPNSDTLKSGKNNAVNPDSNSIPPPINPDRKWDSIERKIGGGLYDEAIREALDNLEIRPNDPQLNWLLGLIHIKKGLFPEGFSYISKGVENGMPVVFDVKLFQALRHAKRGTLKVQKDGLELQFDQTTIQLPYKLIRDITVKKGFGQQFFYLYLKAGINQNNKIEEKGFTLEEIYFFHNYSLTPYDRMSNAAIKFEGELHEAWVRSVFNLIAGIKAKAQ